MNPEYIEELQANLLDARAYLREQSVESVIDTLTRVLGEFRNPNTSARLTMEGEFPSAIGFSPENVREGLSQGFKNWTGEALRKLIEREIGAMANLDQASSCMVSGFNSTAVILAGTIPMPTVLTLLAPLILRSPVLAKTSSHDPVTARVLASTLSEIDPGLGSCLQVIDFPSSDKGCLDALLKADCVIATGSDETITSISKRIQPAQRFVCYGHRLSVVVLGPETVKGDNLQAIAEGIALDVALWDQLGCLSPVAVYLVDEDEDAANRLAKDLSHAMRIAEGHWPRGRISTEVSAQIAQERAAAEMRKAAGKPVWVYSSGGTSWTVIREEDYQLRPNPLHRFLRVHPVQGLGDLRKALLPLSTHLAAVALDGFGGETPRVARLLADLGASRVCQPGTLQSPPLDWHHDNRGVLSPLARFTDLEQNH